MQEAKEVGRYIGIYRVIGLTVTPEWINILRENAYQVTNNQRLRQVCFMTKLYHWSKSTVIVYIQIHVSLFLLSGAPIQNLNSVFEKRTKNQ